MIEKAYVYQNGDEIEQGARYYIGSEFCERLLPSPADCKRIIERIRTKGGQCTLCTSWVTDTERVLRLLPILEPEDEIVFNDWGVFASLKNTAHPLIMGRLLNPQKKDPRSSRDRTAPPFIGERFGKMLLRQNVIAIECDDPEQIQDFSDTPIPGHLCYPYSYITVTRKCLIANSTSLRNRPLAITSCNGQCTDTISMKNEHFDLLLKGNVQLIDKSHIPLDKKRLRQKGITRIVYQSRP